jgi:signal transduction histidine kinase
LERVAEEKGLAFHCEIDSQTDGILLGDSARLSQIAFNLADNAVKFTEIGQVIFRVGVEDIDEQNIELCIEVEDTGIGISESQHEKVFDVFTQADDSAARRHGGTGLGLAIASRLVARMGGRIWVESTIGRGSTFFAVVSLGRIVDSAPIAELASE